MSNEIIPTHTLVTTKTDEYDVQTITRTPVLIDGDLLFSVTGALVARMDRLQSADGFIALEEGAFKHSGQTIQVDRESLHQALAHLVGALGYLQGDSPIKAASFAFAALSQLEDAVGIKHTSADVQD